MHESTGNKNDTLSYFDLPSAADAAFPGQIDERYAGSSGLAATSHVDDETITSQRRTSDARPDNPHRRSSFKKRTSNTDTAVGSQVLLVEDNEINMKVRLRSYSKRHPFHL